MSTLSLLPHNATAYDKINSKLKSGARSVLYVAGTGTGKTYVTNALLTNNWLGRKVAYVVPTVAIWDYISGVLGNSSNITMFTYSAFTNPKTLKLLSEKYDVVIFDEETPLTLIQQLLPDILVKGSDYDPKDIVGGKEVIANGGKVVTVPLVEGFSSTKIINKLKDQA